MFVVEVKNLNKSYGKFQAVRDVSFFLEKGEIFGLLGPNGAGKTTTMEILEGLKQPDSGQMQILGIDPQKTPQAIRSQVGIVPQSSGFFPELTIAELFQLFASFYKIQQNPTVLIEKFDLREILQKKFLELSGGQRQRFVLAIALLNDPKILFLDEPTIGLDPNVRQKFWDIILGLRESGLTILLTTHYMEEAEIVCDRVAIIDQGRIVASDRPTKLINSLGVATHIRFMSNKTIDLGDLEALSGIRTVRRERYNYDLETEMPEVSLRELLTWEKQFAGKIFSLSVKQATLEDVFLKLTGHSLKHE